jgi:hypothetical protein
MSDAWARNEARARQMEREEGKQVGYENRPKRTLHDGAGRPVEFVQDSALGLDGRDIHIGGDKVSVLKEECVDGGDIIAYYQNENGGTYAQRWEKVADGTHRSAEKPRKIHSF